MNRGFAYSFIWFAAAGVACLNAYGETFLDKLKKQVDVIQQQVQTVPALDKPSGVNWMGTYFCNGRDSAIKLSMQNLGGNAMQATAYINPAYVVNNPSASYELQGTYDPESRTLDLAPVQWIEPLPKGYVMLGFKGQLKSDGNNIEGKVSYGTCNAIRLSHIAGTSTGIPDAALATARKTSEPGAPVETPVDSVVSDLGANVKSSGGRSQAAPDRNLERFDVAGVRLGMSIEQAKKALLHFDPTLKISDTFGSLERVNDSKFLGFFVAKSEVNQNWTSRQEIRVDFSPPPHEGRVIALRRHVEYREGARPTITKTIEALDAKYGIPSAHEESSAGGMRQYAFNEDATPVSQGATACMNQTPSSIDATVDVFFNIMPSKICGLTLYASMYSDHGGLHGNGADQLLILLDQSLVNAADIRGMRVDTEKYISEKVKAQSKSVAAPAL